AAQRRRSRGPRAKASSSPITASEPLPLVARISDSRPQSSRDGKQLSGDGTGVHRMPVRQAEIEQGRGVERALMGGVAIARIGIDAVESAVGELLDELHALQCASPRARSAAYVAVAVHARFLIDCL